MTGGATLVWTVVIAIAVWAGRARTDGAERRHQAHRLIVGGALAPVVVLGVLLVYGLSMLAESSRAVPSDALRISVYGEQWWWRFHYEPPGRPPFDAANELRLPLGRPVEFLLNSNNVIHSFWIPSLAGKRDLIPGRTNRLVIHPTQAGTFRGVCAEFCGRGHAKMAFSVTVESRQDFDRWLDTQTQ